MSLTTARGPLGPDPSGRFSAPVPGGLVYVEPFARRVRGTRGGDVLVDSERVLLVHEPGRPPRYAFPADDAHASVAEPCAQAAGHVFVAWDALDEWFEEEERVFVHPRNPYHRVDCRPTARRLRVDVAGTTLVDTTDTVIVFETALEPRLYVSPKHVRTELLIRSDTGSYCNYKGNATYWSATIGDVAVEDIAWSYDDPLPESLCIKGFLSFDAARADVQAELPAGGE